MSYDPSQAQGTKAVQIDINGATTLSDDFTAHASTSFTSRCKYLVESKYFVTVNSSASGLVLYYNWTGFQWAGGTMRCNTATSMSSVTDDNFVGSNSPGVSLSQQSASLGTAVVVSASSKMFSQFWRIQ